MKASELRIGNLIIANGLHSGEIRTVNAFDNSELIENRVILFKGHSTGEFAKDCKGIPLSEEWLLKFGFFRKEQIATEYFFGCTLFQDRSSDEFVIPYDNSYHYIRDISSSAFDGSTEYRTAKIKYVHQLQNLYFALTGEELTIKEGKDKVQNDGQRTGSEAPETKLA